MASLLLARGLVQSQDTDYGEEPMAIWFSPLY